MPDLRDVLWFLGTGEAESFRDDRILESGTRAAASVLSWRQFGRTGHGTTQPNIRMRLRVEPRVEAAYEVKWSGAAGAGEVDFTQMPEARSGLQEVLRRHGFPPPP